MCGPNQEMHCVDVLSNGDVFFGMMMMYAVVVAAALLPASPSPFPKLYTKKAKYAVPVPNVLLTKPTLYQLNKRRIFESDKSASLKMALFYREIVQNLQKQS